MRTVTNVILSRSESNVIQEAIFCVPYGLIDLTEREEALCSVRNVANRYDILSYERLSRAATTLEASLRRMHDQADESWWSQQAAIPGHMNAQELLIAQSLISQRPYQIAMLMSAYEMVLRARALTLPTPDMRAADLVGA